MPSDAADRTVKIILNGEACEFMGKSLAQLIDQRSLHKAAIATAVNGEFVHRHERAVTMLKERDRVEIVAPMEGG